jgi:predicted amidohydrolase
MKDITAGSVQFNHIPGDKEANLRRIGLFTQQAAKRRVGLLVFPEMCITGYWHVRKLSREDIEALSESVPEGPSTRELLRLSAEYGITLGAGLIERSQEKRLYNTYVVAMPDGRTARHRKLHCFISEHMVSGDAYTVFETPEGVRVGVLTCYDNNIIENVRITALMGAEVLLAPHQTGGCDTPSPRCMGLIDPKLWENRNKDPGAIEAEFRGPKGREWLMRWLPARAHDNGMFLVFSNGVGLDDNEVRTGNAMILDPYGEILAETWQAEETMVTADLEAERLQMCTGSRWIKSRRPDLYELLTVPTGSERDIRSLRFAGKRIEGKPK